MATTVDPRRLRWDACYNVRDLGAFPTRSGARTRWRSIVRSDNLCRLTRHGRRALLLHGIRTVIDLRSESERRLETDPFSSGDLEEVAYVSVPLMTEEFLERSEAGLTEAFEIVLLRMCSAAVAELFTVIASADIGGVLIYCHAGKERTGVAAALLLALCGVDNETISAEYALSDRYLEPLYESWLAAEPSDVARERMARGFVTAPDRMTGVLALVERDYGDVAEYLRATGLAERDLVRVRQRLLGADADRPTEAGRL